MNLAGAAPGDIAGPVFVAVQGELGSNSELAAHEYFGDRELEIVPCPTFAALFDALDQSAAGYAMAPVENSLAGGVHPVWDLLHQRRPPVAGELTLRIAHCLISHPGTQVGTVTDVYSHPQALAQCQRYLGSLPGVRQHEVYDTAGAVKMIAGRHVSGEAAIASAQAAADYGMEIVAADIVTEPENYTRFLVLGSATPPSAAAAGPLRTTLIAELGDRARLLPQLLAPLASRRLEIFKVECAKRLGKPWTYLAWLDVAGSPHAPPLAAALAEVEAAAPGLCALGPYLPGPTAEPRLLSR